MEKILIIKIYSEDNSEGLKYYKILDSNLIPRIGEKIRESLFAEDKSITDIVYDFQNNKIYIKLPDKLVKNEAMHGHIQEVADLHKWKILED